MTGRLSLIAMILACAADVCLGHGIAAVRVDGGVGVGFVYYDGTPVTFSDVSVFAPGAGDKPTLAATTDRNGCFMFRPDTNGVWKVTVDDGMGHAITHEIVFDGQAAAPAKSCGRMPTRYGTVIGLAVICGVFGWPAFLHFVHDRFLRRKPAERGRG
jgi:nickel transport protein